MKLRFTIDIEIEGDAQEDLNAALLDVLPALNTTLDDIGYGWSTGGSTASVEIVSETEASS